MQAGEGEMYDLFGEFKKASEVERKEIIAKAQGFVLVYQLIILAISIQEPPSTMNALFQKFLDNYDDMTPDNHVQWVGLLREEITEYLWRHHRFEWITKFNQVVFNRHHKQHPQGSEYLVTSFAEHAHWTTSAQDLGISLDVCDWLRSCDYPDKEYLIARLMHGRFADESDFLCFRITHHNYEKLEGRSGMMILDFASIKLDLDRLKLQGADVSGYLDFFRSRMEKQIQELREQLTAFLNKHLGSNEHQATARFSWAIEKLQEQLDELVYY